MTNVLFTCEREQLDMSRVEMSYVRFGVGQVQSSVVCHIYGLFCILFHLFILIPAFCLNNNQMIFLQPDFVLIPLRQ